ncbi:MAG: Crp/Fnr family transcriptional regulator [Vicinamibacterales bacterium]
MAEAHLSRTILESAAGGPLPGWADVAQGVRVKRYRPKQEVFGDGEVHPYVYVVRDGLLKLSYVNESGSEWIKSFAYEGRFFASLSALDQDGRTSFAVTALEPSVLERLDYRVLARMAERSVVWARALQRLLLVFAARKEQRERELLTLSPRERYLAFRDAHPDLEQRIPQKDLARHLGVTPVGLNRIVMRLRRG